MTVQPGVFALGVPEHCYLELGLHAGRDAGDALTRLYGLHEALTTVAGVSVVVGVRPELWAGLAPADAPADAASFTDDIVGPDGFRMPATQHDMWVWIAGGARTVVFDNAQTVVAGLAGVADLATEVTGWLYRHDRDLTGFVDGTENPSLFEAPSVAAVPDGSPGAGASVLLVQQWRHETSAWAALPQADQEGVMGRTKPDSVELGDDVKPASSHVARTSYDVDGQEQHIFRRNVAYGGVSEHGTYFVGFSRDRARLAEMLRRMAGADGGLRDALTRYTTPLTGAYYVVPSVEQLARFAPPPTDRAPGS